MVETRDDMKECRMAVWREYPRVASMGAQEVVTTVDSLEGMMDRTKDVEKAGRRGMKKAG